MSMHSFSIMKPMNSKRFCSFVSMHELHGLKPVLFTLKKGIKSFFHEIGPFFQWHLFTKKVLDNWKQEPKLEKHVHFFLFFFSFF